MSSSTILVIGLAGVLTMPLVWRGVSRRFDPFEPLVLFAVAYGTVFVARPAWMLLHDDLSLAGVDLRGTLPLVTLLALCGGVAFVVAYELRPGVALARRLPAPRDLGTRAIAGWSLGFAAIAALAVLVRETGLVGGSGEVGSATVTSEYAAHTTALLVPASLGMVALAFRKRSVPAWAAAALILAGTLAYLFPEGRRIVLLPLLGGIFVFVYAHRGRRPSLPTLVALAAVALVASYAAVVARDEQARARAGDEFVKVVKRPDLVLDLVLTRGDAEMAPVLAGALTAVPEQTGYRWGRVTIGELLVRPIPRQLWSSKPRPVSDRIVAMVWPAYVGTTFRPAFTPLLSLYWDFGVAGVIAGMAMFGIACRALYEWFSRHRDALAAKLVFSAALWYVVVGVRNDPVDTVVLASFVVVPLVLVAWLSRPSPARSRGPRGGPSDQIRREESDADGDPGSGQVWLVLDEDKRNVGPLRVERGQ